mmetsp:Transcript_204/g.184  ORF Transcript_204/g.184 Transcript_204/m.184 type:complete len:208 (-) Transcript_204:716-1339(-)
MSKKKDINQLVGNFISKMFRNLINARFSTRLGSQLAKNTIGARINTAKVAPGVSFMRFNSSNFKLNTESFVYKYKEAGPKFIKFTEEHEWVAFQRDDSVFVGITQYASEALGETTYVELPEVGDTVEVGESIGSVESVKSASEIYSPVAGEIVAVNQELESNPQLINDDPMGNAWIAQIKLNEPAEIVEGQESLLNETQYEELLDSN